MSLHQRQVWTERRVGEPVPAAVIARPAFDAGYQFQFDATSQASTSRSFIGSGPLIQIAQRLSRNCQVTSRAEHRRVGCFTSRRGRPVSHSHAVHNGLHRLRVPAARGAVSFPRRLSVARRAQLACLPQHVSCQGANAAERHDLKRPFKRLVADDRQPDVKGLAVGQAIFGEKQNAFG